MKTNCVTESFVYQSLIIIIIKEEYNIPYMHLDNNYYESYNPHKKNSTHNKLLEFEMWLNVFVLWTDYKVAVILFHNNIMLFKLFCNEFY